MRIAFFMQDRGAVYGAERATLDLAYGLQRRTGVDVLLILIEEKRLRAADSDVAGEARLRGIPCRVISTASRVSPFLISALRSLLETERVDVLHTIGYKADLHGGWATRAGKRTPIVSTVHGWLDRPDRKERFYGWLNRQALRRFPRVIVLSSYYETWLSKLKIRSRVRIPSGFPRDRLIPPDTARASFPDSGLLTFGIMGRLSAEKNHAMFLRAARRLVERDAPVRFLIAGEGPDREKIEKAIRNEGLQQHVNCVGYCDSDEFMQQLHGLVMCSKMENLPYAIMEAMNWMRPVIATRVGGIPDLVEDGVTGYLVDLDDDAAMADALSGLMADPGRRRACGEAGRMKLESEFGQERAIAKHMNLYAELLSER